MSGKSKFLCETLCLRVFVALNFSFLIIEFSNAGLFKNFDSVNKSGLEKCWYKVKDLYLQKSILNILEQNLYVTTYSFKSMKKIIHKAESRGFQDHGWLKAAHSFSFANYYDPARVHFGLLRVLNDDIVAPGMGFGTHPHDNMEIVTIPLKGALAHKDSLGSEGVIGPDEVQVMSAGSGIRHSEFNASATEEVNLLQIWVFPKERNIEPRYDQKKFSPNHSKNSFQTLVSPEPDGEAMWINQYAYFSIGNFDEGANVSYKIKHSGNGAYVYVIEGEAKIVNETLSRRDALGIFDTDEFNIAATKDSKILVIDVPMA